MEPRGESRHQVTLGVRAWHVETIWEAARGLPVESTPLDGLKEIDEDCWFSGGPATVRAVADHARRIDVANLDLPVILASDGQVLDGLHRIAKAVLLGRSTVLAQRLPVDPEPDWLVKERPQA
ncbi:MAG: hypothetical protein ABI890_13140 [Lapillicoccus sp.]